MPRHISRAGLQIRPEGVDAAELEQIRLLDLWPAELLQLLEPAAQHRLDALVYLDIRKVRPFVKVIRLASRDDEIDNDLTMTRRSEREIEKRAKANTWNGLMDFG